MDEDEDFECHKYVHQPRWIGWYHYVVIRRWRVSVEKLKIDIGVEWIEARTVVVWVHQDTGAWSLHLVEKRVRHAWVWRYETRIVEPPVEDKYAITIYEVPQGTLLLWFLSFTYGGRSSYSRRLEGISSVAMNQSETKARRFVFLFRQTEADEIPRKAFCVCLSTLEDIWRNLEQTIAIGDSSTREPRDKRAGGIGYLPASIFGRW